MKRPSRSMLLGWCVLALGVTLAAGTSAQGMMDGGMMGIMHGWTMIAWVLFGVLILTALVLAIVAVVKYLRGDRRPGP